MSKKDDKTQAVAVRGVGDVATAVLPTLFKNIDFTGLNGAIEKMGNASTDIQTPEERQAGVQIVNEWQTNVIAKLYERVNEVRKVISFFDTPTGGAYNEDQLESIGQTMATRTNTTDEYTALMDAITKLKAIRHTRPQQLFFTGEETKLEEMKAKQAYELEHTAYEIKERRAEREVFNKHFAWKKLLNQHKDVQSMLKQSNQYIKQLDQFKEDCKDKAQSAKLNLSISSKETRDAIRELLSFTTLI